MTLAGAHWIGERRLLLLFAIVQLRRTQPLILPSFVAKGQPVPNLAQPKLGFLDLFLEDEWTNQISTHTGLMYLHQSSLELITPSPPLCPSASIDCDHQKINLMLVPGFLIFGVVRHSKQAALFPVEVYDSANHSRNQSENLKIS